MLKRKIFSRSAIIYNFILWILFMILYLGFRHYTTYSLLDLKTLALSLKWIYLPCIVILFLGWNLYKKPKFFYVLFFGVCIYDFYKLNRYDFSDNYIYLDLSVMFIYALLYLLFNNELSKKTYKDFYAWDLSYPQVKVFCQDNHINVLDYSSGCLVLETSDAKIAQVYLSFRQQSVELSLQPIQLIGSALVLKIINISDWIPVYKEIKSYGLDTNIFKG